MSEILKSNPSFSGSQQRETACWFSPSKNISEQIAIRSELEESGRDFRVHPRQEEDDSVQTGGGPAGQSPVRPVPGPPGPGRSLRQQLAGHRQGLRTGERQVRDIAVWSSLTLCTVCWETPRTTTTRRGRGSVWRGVSACRSSPLTRSPLTPLRSYSSSSHWTCCLDELEDVSSPGCLSDPGSQSRSEETSGEPPTPGPSDTKKIF